MICPNFWLNQELNFTNGNQQEKQIEKKKWINKAAKYNKTKLRLFSTNDF